MGGRGRMDGTDGTDGADGKDLHAQKGRTNVDGQDGRGTNLQELLFSIVVFLATIFV